MIVVVISKLRKALLFADKILLSLSGRTLRLGEIHGWLVILKVFLLGHVRVDLGFNIRLEHTFEN